MTNSDTVFTLLVCSVSGERLRMLADSEVEGINRRLRTGALRPRGDGRAPSSVEGALLAPRAGLLYPIVDDLPRLLPEDALRITS